jgi:hypothetical protein
MRNRDIEQPIRNAGEIAGERVRQYADGAADRAQGLYDRGRQLRDRFSQRGNSYSRRLSHKAEDFADEANYHYRRLRRQVSRNPVTSVAIVAGTIGAFLLLRRIFRSDDE